MTVSFALPTHTHPLRLAHVRRLSNIVQAVQGAFNLTTSNLTLPSLKLQPQPHLPPRASGVQSSAQVESSVRACQWGLGSGSKKMKYTVPGGSRNPKKT